MNETGWWHQPRAQVIALTLILALSANCFLRYPHHPGSAPINHFDLYRGYTDISYQLDLQLLQMLLNHTRQEISLAHPHPNAKWREESAIASE